MLLLSPWISVYRTYNVRVYILKGFLMDRLIHNKYIYKQVPSPDISL